MSDSEDFHAEVALVATRIAKDLGKTNLTMPDCSYVLGVTAGMLVAIAKKLIDANELENPVDLNELKAEMRKALIAGFDLPTHEIITLDIRPH